MADCSKILEYVKELSRMCEYYLNTDSQCDKCPLNGLRCNELTSITQKHITGVQTWSDCHPVKTRQSEFLKMFPNTGLELDFIAICPRQLGEITLEECKKKSQRHCDDCRREYWMEEIK